MTSENPLLSLTSILRRQSAGSMVQDGSKAPTGDWRQAAEQHPEDLVLESWSQGFLVGALIIMACITIANMRKGVILHKLIFLELLLAMMHGTFCFMSFKGYGWYLSSTATLLYLSWIMHNVIAWMKVKPFFTYPGGFFNAKLGVWVRRIYLGTLAMSVPVILFQISNNFRFFNNLGGWYVDLRPYEFLMRDPWWVFACLTLFHVIRKCYGTGVIGLVKRSPRFGILMIAIVFSIVFTICDAVDSIHSFVGQTDGINPWWKLSLVFKCLTDTIMLDDFKTELKRLGIKRVEKDEANRNSIALVAEYPSGLDGPDPGNYTSPRRQTLFKHNHNPFHSKKISKESTTYQVSRDLRDKNEDPLSEYAAHREQQIQHQKRGTNDPNAHQEEVEFATALTLDPTDVSGISSIRSNQPSERQNMRTTTRKIGRLPGLREFRFEAIKPGKKSNRRESDQSEKSLDEDKDTSPQFRNLAEEIHRNTIMDLEAQKEAKAARRSRQDESTDESQEEEKRRVNRFRASIGAPE